MKIIKMATALSVWTVLATVPASAEMELNIYTGVQTAPHSRVSGTDPTNGGVGDFNFLSSWGGRSFEAPPHYGMRAIYWTNKNLGFGADFNHVKVYADAATRSSNGFDRLEFTDGLNILTLNAWYRFPDENRRWTPYIGAGAGVAIPHVDVETAGSKTFEYQLTGAAIQLVAGVHYSIDDTWGIFGEYKGTYSRNKADLTGGGSLETNIVTNAANFGLSYRF